MPTAPQHHTLTAMSHEVTAADRFRLTKQNIDAHLMDAVDEHIQDKHITQDKLAREVRVVAQMAALDGNYKDSIGAYRLVGELKHFITKNGEPPPPAGGVHLHQHQHNHLTQDDVGKASDEDLIAQLGSLAKLEHEIKDAEFCDDVDLT